MPTYNLGPCDCCGDEPPIQTDCCPDPIPFILYVTVPAVGTCPGVTLPMVYDGISAWFSPVYCAEAGRQFSMTCNPETGDWIFSLDFEASQVSIDCDPFELVFDLVDDATFDICCGTSGGTVTVTVTAVAP